MTTDVLICGAGPTGLVLALQLARAGVRVRVVDAAAEPGTTSRALVVHARTLEIYRQMGLADAFLDEGVKFEAVNLWVRRRRVAHVELGAIGKGLTPFPHLIVCAQDRHERFLAAQLERAGVRIERASELIDFEQTSDRVRARLRTPAGDQTCEAAFLAGCDGAHSRVREVIGVGFPGGTYSHVFYVADVDATGPMMNSELHVALDDADFMAVFPLKGGTTARLIGTVEAEDERAREALTWDDVGRRTALRLRIEVSRVNWFSTYRVHHRVASRFRDRRVFLLGDAAHVHSPAGAQGMNTGIGDAANLGWKLADVVHGRARATLLDSYEPERIAFARRLVATTDRAFVIATSEGRLARFVRLRIVPRVLPALLRFAAVRRFVFRTVSQTAVSYRGGPLSAGRQGAVHGGDRLPWVEDNFAVVDGRAWRVHVYGNAGPGVEEACRSLGLPLHVFAWRPVMGKAGLVRDALYLVRPDGYIALADPGTSPAALVRYVEALFGRPSDRPTPA